MGLGGGGGGKGKGGGRGGKGGGKNGSLLSLPGNIVGSGKGAARGAMGKGGGGKGKSMPGMLGSSMGKMGQGLGKFGQGLSGMPGLMGQMMNQGMFPPYGQQGGLQPFGMDRQQPQQQQSSWSGMTSPSAQPSAPGFTGQGMSGQNHMQGLGQSPSAFGSAAPGQSMSYGWNSGSSTPHGIGQSGGSSGMPNLQEAPPAPWDQRVNR